MEQVRIVQPVSSSSVRFTPAEAEVVTVISLQPEHRHLYVRRFQNRSGNKQSRAVLRTRGRRLDWFEAGDAPPTVRACSHRALRHPSIGATRASAHPPRASPLKATRRRHGSGPAKVKKRINRWRKSETDGSVHGGPSWRGGNRYTWAGRRGAAAAASAARGRVGEQRTCQSVHASDENYTHAWCT